MESSAAIDAKLARLRKRPSTLDDPDLPDYFTVPLTAMFPLRVERQPRDADGKPLPLRNHWIGRNGAFVQIAEGGRYADGSPRGIVGHALPIALNMHASTEMKFPRFPGTDPLARRISLGSSLPELARWVGIRGNLRGGGEKPQRFLERLGQYMYGRHRLIMCGSSTIGWELYLWLRAIVDGDPRALVECEKRGVKFPPRGPGAPFIPAPEEIAAWAALNYPHATRPRDLRSPVVEQCEIWESVQLGDPLTSRRDSYMVLTQEFVDNYVAFAVPLATPLVMRLVRSAQQFSLAVYFSQLNHDMWVSGDLSRELRIAAIQDAVGLGGAELNKRPEQTVRQINGMALQWKLAAAEMGRPEAAFRWDEVKSVGQTPAKGVFHRVARLFDVAPK
jgi:hypothetical protein